MKLFPSPLINVLLDLVKAINDDGGMGWNKGHEK
jgi:hypothetical protein